MRADLRIKIEIEHAFAYTGLGLLDQIWLERHDIDTAYHRLDVAVARGKHHPAVHRQCPVMRRPDHFRRERQFALVGESGYAEMLEACIDVLKPDFQRRRSHLVVEERHGRVFEHNFADVHARSG